VGSVHVVLPAYNEAAALRPLLERLAALRLGPEHALRVWVVDDGSVDATGAVARQGSGGLEVGLITHPVNLGLGQAVNTGLHSVLQSGADQDCVVVMDADDTHDVNLIPAMLDRLESGADIVIASRFVPQGDDSTAPAFRRLLSRGAAFVFRSLLPLDGLHDFTSGYRAYRVGLLRRAAQHWGERLIAERGFACMVELLLKLRHCKPVIHEVPLVLRYDRKPGRSKLKLARTTMQYLKLLLRERLAPPPWHPL
jgi:dolichol-phosphate mannosyltransferase